MRWLHCHADQITKQGRDEHQRARQRYRCLGCRQKFDDLTGTVFAGQYQPLRVWVAGLYLMGLNLSHRQIAHELGINEDDAQPLTRQLRQGVVAAGRLPQYLEQLTSDIALLVLPARRPRSYPRAVKIKMTRYPRKVRASAPLPS